VINLVTSLAEFSTGVLVDEESRDDKQRSTKTSLPKYVTFERGFYHTGCELAM
jgi:hypothetical protein